MKEGESVDEYLTHTLPIANKIRIHSENMQNVVIIEKKIEINDQGSTMLCV